EAELLREVERNRPLVVGGFEILIVVVVAAVALVLLERVVRERRITLPEGGALERADAAGLGLGETLGSLFPRRRSRRRPPREDGSAAAALRVLYWRLLALAERSGHGWREPSETPDEHYRRVVGRDTRWGAAAPLVETFEELRYGERDPDRGALARARDAFATVEAAVRT
ncbi:MAG: DUF4129 domain-containing protein, partial [Chloroflexi bacterium]